MAIAAPGPPPGPPTDNIPLTEDERVERWRYDAFVALGVDRADALWMCDVTSEIDCHELEALIRDGCPVETAIRIVA